MKSYRLTMRAIAYLFILTWTLIGVVTGPLHGQAALIPPDTAKITRVQGRVQFVLHDAQEKPTGLVLKDRTVVLFSPESLQGAPPQIGTMVSVHGYANLESPNRVIQQSAVFEPGESGRVIVDETGTPNPLAPPNFDAPGRFSVLKKATVRSSVFAFIARGNGDIDRLVLKDGTLVQVSSGGAVDQKKLKLNTLVTVSGIGGGSQVGGRFIRQFIQAMSIKDSHQFQQILAQGSDRESWMTVDGKIAQILLTPRGLVNGVVLGDHSAIRFRPVPPEDASQLKTGVHVEAAGAGKENQVFVGSILLNEQGIGLSTLSASNLPTPEPSRDLDRMYDRSQILTVLKDVYGDPETLILTDGTSVQIPPDIRRGLDFYPRPGEVVSLEGYGGKYADGTAIRASSLRRDVDSDQPA